MHSDDGHWSCLMGIADGGEHDAAVSVTVTGWKMLILFKKFFLFFYFIFLRKKSFELS